MSLVENDVGAARQSEAVSVIVDAVALRKTYYTHDIRVDALSDVSIRVLRGEMVAVMGPSGCGKTTLLNCLAGLDDIDAGQARIDGTDLSTLSDSRRANYRAHHMGFIFQNFNLLPVLSAAENVELPLLLLGKRAREARRRAREMLATVGLTDRERHRPAELSGGQRQRVAIARALVNEPAIVWADEPTGNLDSDAADEIMDLLVTLNRERAQTLVLVTHAADIGARAHRIVRMRDGHIVADAG